MLWVYRAQARLALAGGPEQWERALLGCASLLSTVSFMAAFSASTVVGFPTCGVACALAGEAKGRGARLVVGTSHRY